MALIVQKINPKHVYSSFIIQTFKSYWGVKVAPSMLLNQCPRCTVHHDEFTASYSFILNLENTSAILLTNHALVSDFWTSVLLFSRCQSFFTVLPRLRYKSPLKHNLFIPVHFSCNSESKIYNIQNTF